MIYKPRSEIVRTRSQRKYKAVNNPKGVIYLPSTWVGNKVKVVDRELWVRMVKRIYNLEHRLIRIKKLT